MPLITFDHHYSSDEEMTGAPKKMTPIVGGKKVTTNRKRDEMPSATVVKEVIGKQREAVVMREDEGLTAIKRRIIEKEETSNT
jgi:hypothetical protein